MSGAGWFIIPLTKSVDNFNEYGIHSRITVTMPIAYKKDNYSVEFSYMRGYNAHYYNGGISISNSSFSRAKLEELTNK